MQILADCYAVTTLNLSMALGFYSRFYFAVTRESEVRTSFNNGRERGDLVRSIANGPEAHQEWKWKMCLKTEVGSPVSEAYRLPRNAKPLVGIDQPEGTDRQGLFGAQLCAVGMNVTLFVAMAYEDVGRKNRTHSS